MTKFKIGDRIVDNYVGIEETGDYICMGTVGVITKISKHGVIHYKNCNDQVGVVHPKNCELINDDVPFKRGLDDLLSVKPRPPECPKEENADNSSCDPCDPLDNQLKRGQMVRVFDRAKSFIATVIEMWANGTVIVKRLERRKKEKDFVAVHPMQCRTLTWSLLSDEEIEKNKNHIPGAAKMVEWCECIGDLVFNIKTKIHETCGKPIKHIRDLGAILNNLASGTTSINEIKTKESHARVDNVLRDGKISKQERRIEELGKIAESHKICLHDSLKRFVVLEEKYNALDQEIKKIKAAREVENADNEGDSLRPVVDDLLANQKHIDAELLSLRRLFKANKANSDVCPNCNGTQFADLRKCGFCCGSGVVKPT